MTVFDLTVVAVLCVVLRSSITLVANFELLQRSSPFLLDLLGEDEDLCYCLVRSSLLLFQSLQRTVPLSSFGQMTYQTTGHCRCLCHWQMTRWTVRQKYSDVDEDSLILYLRKQNLLILFIEHWLLTYVFDLTPFL